MGLHEQEVQRALAAVRWQAELVIEIRCRIREGSQRLIQAFTRARVLMAQGDATGARGVLEATLAREQLPLYRESV